MKKQKSIYKLFFFAILICISIWLRGKMSVVAAPVLEKQTVSNDFADSNLTIYFPIVFTPPIPANWEQVDFGRENITDIIISTSPRRIFASAYNVGFFESQDNGASWQKQDVHPRINDIELNPTSTNLMYLATWSSVGVYQTQDGGAAWEPTIGWYTLYPTLYSVAMHPISHTVMFAGSGNWESVGGEIYKTANEGESWYPVSPQYTNALTFVFDPSSPETIFAGTLYTGVMKSIDGGESWASANNKLPTGTNGAHNISSLALHPNNHQWLFAATSLGVFVSYDSAGQWEPLWEGINAYALVFDPHNPDNIYIGTNKGMFISYDSGLTWSQIGQCGLNKIVNQLTIDPMYPSVIWVGTNDGIWKCTLK